MNPDAKVNRMSPRTGRRAMTLNVPCRGARAIRMILACGWPAEYRNPAVPRIMDDLPPETLHRKTDMIQPLVQKRLRFVRIASPDMAG